MLDCGGNWSALFRLFDEHCAFFPDLIQETAAVNKNNLRVDDKKATLVVEAEANGEMYVSLNSFVHILITFVIIGFEADC